MAWPSHAMACHSYFEMSAPLLSNSLSHNVWCYRYITSKGAKEQPRTSLSLLLLFIQHCSRAVYLRRYRHPTMTVYSLFRYRWQTPAEIGAQASDYCWLLRQERDRTGFMFTRFVERNGVWVQQFFVLESSSHHHVDGDSDLDYKLTIVGSDVCVLLAASSHASSSNCHVTIV